MRRTGVLPQSMLMQSAWAYGRTGLALLDAHLRLCAMNPAFAEHVGPGRRWQQESLAVVDADPPSLSDGARRARHEQRTVLLRDVAMRGQATESIFDVAFIPLDDGQMLLELHCHAATAAPAPTSVSQSLRGFAHEVKNPLAGMRGAAQLLRRRVATPDLAELAELILAEVDRLAALSDRLLQTGGKPRLARIDVHEVTERVAVLIATQSPEVQQTRDYDPSLPTLNGDADRLMQVLLNLARNAVAAGARHLTWRTRAEHAARIGDHGVRLALRIDLVDDGSGVPPELIDTLFHPLVSGRPDGTGLGLALAQEIAREHGGELRHSNAHGATRFSVLLPVGDTHAC